MSEPLVFECALAAAPEKVWRALSIPQYLERWLKPAEAGAELAVLTSDENKSVTYRWRDSGAGAILGAQDSVVTFEITPMADGGTWFRLTHAPLEMPNAANDAAPVTMMLAA